ncbi:MAG: hypothetical protein ACFFFG_00500 [Candidatus Thorarchaeota archaeon]
MVRRKMVQDLGETLNAVWQSVFRPKKFFSNRQSSLIQEKYGWMFILVRWAYYSVIFMFFRDYKGLWRPFQPIPLGFSLDTYAFLQPRVSIFFGIFLMTSIAICLWLYLNRRKKGIQLFRIINTLGVTFFLPFVLVQPIDFFLLSTIGWNIVIIAPLHTFVLIWETQASIILLDHIRELTSSEKVMGGLIIAAVWIFITALFWR